MRYATDFQRLLEYAAYDCGQRGGAEITVDHLMLGLYREDFPLVDEVFATFRVDSMVVLERLLRLNPDDAPPLPVVEVRMGPEALRAVAAAEDEAVALGHDLLMPGHVLVGILVRSRDRLQRYFVRQEVVHGREDEVLSHVRSVVAWLRFAEAPRTDREMEVIDANTVVGLESVAASGREPGFAVQLRMLKHFRPDSEPRRRR